VIFASLALCDDGRHLQGRLEQWALDPLGFPCREPESLLREGLRDSPHYQALLPAIALGRTKLLETAHAVGLDRTAVPGFTKVVGDLRLIERRVLVTDPRRATGRRGIYRLRGTFLSSYGRFNAPQESLLDRRYRGPRMRAMAEQLPAYSAGAFEGQRRP
jgi:uncharacterized protein